MATPLSYRQWLQLKANDSDPVNAWDKNMSSILLGIVGDDGNINANAVGNNTQFTGADGKTYYTAGQEGNFAENNNGLIGVNDALVARYKNYVKNPDLVAKYNQENQGYSKALNGWSSGGGGTVDKDAATRAKLRARIAASGQGIDAAYQDLFGQLENLIKSRDAQLEEQYGKQFKTASDTYAASIPDIENSYAAIGAADSTDQADAKTKADKGFQETTATIGENKAKDKAALGQYDLEQKAKIGADKAAAQQAVSSAGDTTDVSSLLSLANGLDTNLSNTGVTKATLAPDASAQQDITSLTADNGRYQSAIDALDSVIKSSMSGATKAAAVKAITDSSGLSEAEKKKVNDLYGNVYSEQAAL